MGSGTTIEYVQVLAGLDDSFDFFGGAVDARYLISYESGDDHFDLSEGYVGRLQYLIRLQTTRLTPAPGSGLLSSDPQGFEIGGCSGSGCTEGFRSKPLTFPILANFTLVGPPEEPITGGGIGGVWRRGTAGIYHNGILARWPRRALSVRDAVTDTLLQRDSLKIENVIFAANGSIYEPSGTNFAQESKFATANHRLAESLSQILTSVNPANFDWTPIGPAVSGAGQRPLPADRIANFFGQPMQNTPYFGAVDPNGPKWWQGWTVYYIN